MNLAEKLLDSLAWISPGAILQSKISPRMNTDDTDLQA
jgi:hypothetical protein